MILLTNRLHGSLLPFHRARPVLLEASLWRSPTKIDGYAIVIYLKSVLAGIVTVGITTLLYGAVIYAWVQARMWMDSRANPGDTYFVVVDWHFSGFSLVLALAIFFCGAHWMFRRLRLHRAS